MKAIYIGGYGRSGSTLVEDFLVLNLPAMGVGEVTIVFDYCVTGKHCQCGKTLRNCEFWSKVLTSFSDDEIYRIENIRKSKQIPELDSRYRKFLQSFDRRFFKVLSEMTGYTPMLVDSSKTARGAGIRPFKYRDCFDDQMLFVFLRKRPAELLNSLAKGSNRFLQGESNKSYSSKFLFRSFIGWLYANIFALCFALRYPKNTIIVDYRSFCMRPEAFLKRISDRLSIEISTSQHDIVQSHAIAGNRQRNQGKLVIRTEFSTYRPRNIAEFFIFGLFVGFAALFSALAGVRKVEHFLQNGD